MPNHGRAARHEPLRARRGSHRRPGRAAASGAPERERSGYSRIEDYGVIGNLRTAALVGLDGSIDWWCVPRFHSPSVFGALLDARRGGRFALGVEPSAPSRQLYLPDSNILITRFLSPRGMGEICDFMPLDARLETPPLHRIVRRIRTKTGSLDWSVDCAPAFDYGRARPRARAEDGGVVFEADSIRLRLDATRPLAIRDGAARARFRLDEGEEVTFLLQLVEPQGAPALRGRELEADADRRFKETSDFWHGWIGECTYRGRWREHVLRSALALKLLTYESTGGIVAAATTSLPESGDGSRNWDYRFAWVRDAMFVLHALMRIGYHREARRFTHWLLDRVNECSDSVFLRPLYGVDGSEVLDETELTHLEGYRGASPVRIGNEAVHHLQLDIYGPVLEAVDYYDAAHSQVGFDVWCKLVAMLDWVCENWKRPDRGIWEIRGPPQQLTFSKVMCWVALDRGLRIAHRRGLPAERARWERVRDEIYGTVMTRGWNASRRSFVQTLDGDALDASLLLMPMVGIVAPTDPRMLSTIEAIQADLAKGHQVHRYRVQETADGLGTPEGSFNLCTFWLTQALTAAGRLDEARLLFETMLGFGNHLGLYSEEIGASGQALGNFPQALTHLALIRAALDLDRALDAGA